MSERAGGRVQAWATPNERERGPNEGAQPSRRKQEQAEGDRVAGINEGDIRARTRAGTNEREPRPNGGQTSVVEQWGLAGMSTDGRGERRQGWAKGVRVKQVRMSGDEHERASGGMGTGDTNASREGGEQRRTGG
jgi:hypothetical protein